MMTSIKLLTTWYLGRLTLIWGALGRLTGNEVVNAAPGFITTLCET